MIKHIAEWWFCTNTPVATGHGHVTLALGPVWTSVQTPYNSLRVFYGPIIRGSPYLKVLHAHRSATGYKLLVRVQETSKNRACRSSVVRPVWSVFSLCAKGAGNDTRLLHTNLLVRLSWAQMSLCLFCRALAHMLQLLRNFVTIFDWLRWNKHN